MLATSGMVQLGTDLFQFYLPIYGHYVGLSASAIGSVLATLAVASFAVRLFLARLVKQVAADGRLPVVLFCAGGIATPADAALMMQLGAEGNFVGSGIFKSSNPEQRARAIVEATTHYNDPERVAAASRELGDAMPGIEIGTLQENGGLLQHRGW